MFCVLMKPAIKKGAKRRAIIASMLHSTRRKQRKAIDALQPSPFPQRALFGRPRGVTREPPTFTNPILAFLGCQQVSSSCDDPTRLIAPTKSRSMECLSCTLGKYRRPEIKLARAQVLGEYN